VPVVPDLAVEVISPTDKGSTCWRRWPSISPPAFTRFGTSIHHVEQVFVFTAPTQVRILTRWR